MAQKVVVVGAGPVGSLAALYAAQRGDDVEVYELRNDLRDPSTTPLNFTRSINLALSERGIHALRGSASPQLLAHVMAATIPMRGRMVHLRQPDGQVTEQSQDYDAHGRTIFAVDRGDLNKRILAILDGMPNVTLFFNHKLTGADFRAHKAWFEVQGRGEPASGRAREVEIAFDLMIGADGAHSAVRYHLMKFTRMDYCQEYIDTLWCEFQIQKGPAGDFAISPNHLHIWPGKDFMFIAIPSNDGSFTCTLFAPGAVFDQLESSPDQIPPFFDHHFPGVSALIRPHDLIASFHQNPHLPLISIKCSPYHYASSAVVVGDAAHAMVPFYGQGMNAGLEDVRLLFGLLDASHDTAAALAEYSATRRPDAHAINDLALQNYVEMRASVLSPAYRLRKRLEESLSVYLPRLGWQTKYARVSFGNEPYAAIVARSDYQGKVLVWGFVGAVGLPVLAGGFLLWFRFGRTVMAGARACLGWLAG